MNFNLSGWRLWAVLILGFALYPFVWVWEKAKPKINWANEHLGGLSDEDSFF